MTDQLHADDVTHGVTPSTMLWRAVRRRCPRCGGTPVFRRWFLLVDRCPKCGVRYRRDEAFFLGAFTVNLVITLASLFVVLMWLVFREDANPGASLVPPLTVAFLCAIVMPAVLYPISTLVWSALDLSSDPLDIDEIVEAVDAVSASERRTSSDRGDPSSTDPSSTDPSSTDAPDAS